MNNKQIRKKNNMLINNELMSKYLSAKYYNNNKVHLTFYVIVVYLQLKDYTN